MSRCPNCMNELVQERCTRCGYPAVEVSAVRNALPPETVLLERYELGYALGSNHQAIAYVAYDNMRRQPVLVLEFFPKVNAVRKKNAASPKKHPELYMDACRRFLTSEQAMPMRLLHTFAENNTAYRVYQLAGNAANAVQEADELLDNPILFRDANGKPVMAINALPIPPLPHTTEWKLSRRLTSERTRKQVNRVAIGLLGLIAAAVVGVVVFSMNRTYDVTIRVNTEDALTGAMLGDVELGPATPNAEGYVEYTATLKRGEYAFTATSERDMTNQPAVLKAGEENALTVLVPTPTPKPVVVNAEAGEWLYRVGGENPVMVNGGVAEEIVNPLADGQLVNYTITARKQGYAPADGMQLLLVRDGYELPLTWNGGAISIELSRGTYELILRRSADGTQVSVKLVTVSDSGSAVLDMEAYEYYITHLADRPAPESFYYISGGATPLSLADVTKLNEWAEAMPELFGDYRQHNVSFRLAEGIPADAVVTVNGFAWTPGSEMTFTEEATPVEVMISTKDGSLIQSEKFSVEALVKPEYILGQSEADAYAARWQGVTGLMRVDGVGYKQMKDESNPLNPLATVVEAVTDDDWDKLIADTQMYPDKMQYAPKLVTLKVPDYKIKAGAVEWVTIDGVKLVPDPDSQGMVYTVEISEGTWWTDGSLTGDKEHDPIALYIISSSDDYEIKVFNPGYTDAIAYSDYVIPGFVQRLDGTVDYVLSDANATMPIPAEEWLGYAACYNIGAYKRDWTLYPVSMVIDPRIAVEDGKVTAVLDDRPVGLVDVDGVWTLDVSAVTGTNHEVRIYITDENGEKTGFPWPVEYGEPMTLLRWHADAWVGELQYASINGGEPVLIAGDPSRLTSQTVEEIVAALSVEIPAALTIGEPEKWQHLTFALRMPVADAETVDLAPMADGQITFTATAGEYELWVLENPEMGYPATKVMDVSVGGSEAIPLTDSLVALGREYQMSENEDVRIPIDPRIHMGEGSTLYVQADFTEDFGVYLDEAAKDENGEWYVMAEGSLPDGVYDITVTVTDSFDQTHSPLALTYTLTLADETATCTNADGEVVPALLADVADEAQASVRWWGIDPEKLEQLPGGTNTWVLSPAALKATQENAELVYLKYPVGTLDVFAFTSKDWEFTLVTEVGEKTLKQPLEQKIYYGPAEARYQPMYLSAGAEYRLVVTVPGGTAPLEFDLGGIELTTEGELLTLNLLPGENETQMLTEGEKHEDGSPVVELVLGYYGAEYANFSGAAATPTPEPEVTPTPAPEAVVTPTPETTVTPEPEVTPEPDNNDSDTSGEGIVGAMTPAEHEALQHAGAWEPVTHEGCTTAGSQQWVCQEPGCGYRGNIISVNPTGHNYTPKVTKEATCTEKGVTTYTCKNCGDAYTEEIEQLGHAWPDVWDIEEATCTANGSKTRKCTRCSQSQVEQIMATGHQFDEQEEIKAPKCEEAGEICVWCSICGAEGERKYPKALGHDWSDWVVKTAATCKKEGEEVRTCNRDGCGGKETRVIAVDPYNHSYSKQKSKVQTWPTCVEGGTRVYYCLYCDNEKYETIDPTGDHKDRNQNGYCDDCKAPMSSFTN